MRSEIYWGDVLLFSICNAIYYGINCFVFDREPNINMLDMTIAVVVFWGMSVFMKIDREEKS